MNERLTRLKAALQRGETVSAFARSEGLTPQALYDWINRRPDYAAQIAAYRRPGKSKPVSGPEFWRRVEAVQKRRRGFSWKEAGRGLEINDAALRQWVRINRDRIDAALAERRAA